MPVGNANLRPFCINKKNLEHNIAGVYCAHTGGCRLVTR
jgi:hypothetical protein